MKNVLIVMIAVLILGGGIFLILVRSDLPRSPDAKTEVREPEDTEASTKPDDVPPLLPTVEETPTENIVAPLSRAIARVTKKPFAILIDPKTSPVQPERFRGYHVGVDFETFPEEQDIDVPVSAICDGPLLQKRRATGYGGLAIQRCTINGESVTIIYGHLKLSSIKPDVGDEMRARDVFAVLGKGFSAETDGERKHLHLGIHKGTSVSILGYVQTTSSLDAWMDAVAMLR